MMIKFDYKLKLTILVYQQHEKITFMDVKLDDDRKLMKVLVECEQLNKWKIKEFDSNDFFVLTFDSFV